MSLVRVRAVQNTELQVLSNSQIATRLTSVAREIRTAAIARMRQTYNLSRNALAPYLQLRRASPARLNSSLEFSARAVPLEAFKPRVEMRQVTIKSRSGSRVQRLPHILLNRYVGKQPRVIPGAFPLRQRNTGRLRSDEKVRKRTSRARGKLTPLRFYVFPERYLQGELLPYLQRLAGRALDIQFRNAVRKRTKRGRALRRND